MDSSSEAKFVITPEFQRSAFSEFAVWYFRRPAQLATTASVAVIAVLFLILLWLEADLDLLFWGALAAVAILGFLHVFILWSASRSMRLAYPVGYQPSVSFADHMLKSSSAIGNQELDISILKAVWRTEHLIILQLKAGGSIGFLPAEAGPAHLYNELKSAVG